jgi:hypothetical protein
MKLAYCDYLAHTVIRPALLADRDHHHEHRIVQEVSFVKMDLAEEGYMVSTTKYINVTDVNGKMYKVTIEEL